MNNFLRIRNIENIDMDEIDDDSFKEGLLVCAVQTKFNCKLIDNKINHIGIMPRINGVSTMEHYDIIVNLMAMKSTLLTMYDSFKDWYKCLSDKQKQLCKSHFVDRSRKDCKKLIGSDNYRDKVILKMSEHFAHFVMLKTKLTKEELIKNPFVYDAYVRTLRKNEKYSSRKHKQNKGESKNDSPTNERCHY